jgi:hypothetical protein
MWSNIIKIDIKASTEFLCRPSPLIVRAIYPTLRVYIDL